MLALYLVLNTKCQLREGKTERKHYEKKLRKIWKFGQSKGQTEENRTTFNKGGWVGVFWEAGS